MKLSQRLRPWLINLLIAIAISLTVNFSDLIYALRSGAEMSAATSQQTAQQAAQQAEQRADSVRMARQNRDSVPPHVVTWVNRRNLPFKPSDDAREVITISGDTLIMFSHPVYRQPRHDEIRESQRREWRHKRMLQLQTRNSIGYQSIQILAFLLFGAVLLAVNTAGRKTGRRQFVRTLIYSILISVVFFLFAPRAAFGGGISVIDWQHEPFDPAMILKCSLTLIVALLYGKIYELLYQRQNMILENEVLKNENLQATYNSLVNQINPHFFFNSLNSLSMLVREGENQKALDFIDRLSDSFRYSIQNIHTDMSTLGEELKFLEGYMYMLDIRYNGKLFFETDIDEAMRSWCLPTLSLQPLIENAVKHNSITKSSPLVISIRTEGESVVISNPIKPKITRDNGTGIGLQNLSARYSLLTGRDITVANDGATFCVTLPLSPPKNKKQ